MELATIEAPPSELVAQEATEAQSSPARHPGGRPTDYTPAIAEDICRHVRAGFTVRKIASLLGFDDCTLYDWQHAHPEFADHVAQARRFAAAAWADKAADAAAEAARDPGERGEKARGAAVMVGNAQWQAERRDPTNWGQRSALAIDARITVAGETPLSMASFVAARAKVALPVAVAESVPVAANVGATLLAGQAGAVMPASTVTPAVAAAPAPVKWVSRGGPAVR